MSDWIVVDRRGGRPLRVTGERSAAFLGPFVALVMLAAPSLAAEELRGLADVVSGNEIVVGKRTVRLFGISAPDMKNICEINEIKVKCGIIGWAELIKLADGQQISCDREELPEGVPAKDKSAQYWTCYIGETDVNEAMVRSGWASAVPEQTDRYEVDETDAKESGRGLWSNDRKRR